MSMIYILLPLSLLLAATAVGVFIWAAKRGQFDDLETPAHRILFDDREEIGVDDAAERVVEDEVPTSEA